MFTRAALLHWAKTFLRIVLGAFMVVAAIGHLSFQRQEFQAQVPNWVPLGKNLVVVLSGMVELALGLGMIFAARHKAKVGLFLALFYVLVFPGNIAQYVNGIDAFGLDTDQKRLNRLFFQPVLILWALWSTDALHHLRERRKKVKAYKTMRFYQFHADTIKGETISMENFKGKVVVVVNTASKCGLTPQYEGLERLYQQYRDQGLVILGFPCNQFGRQEPGSAEDIQEFCQVNYGVSFPIFAKVKVNGAKAHPIFDYLKSRLSTLLGSSIKWNFTKFVIDRKGNPVKRFGPRTSPLEMETTLQTLLKR